MSNIEDRYLKDENKRKITQEIIEKYPNALQYIENILNMIGDNSSREGLSDTPYRVVKSWLELYSGYTMDPKEILSTVFEDGMNKMTDEIVICKNIKFYSQCEHHMLPFIGKCHIGYLPDKRVVGLSKLARLVECFSRRLQIQEKLGTDIAESLEEHLKPQGVGVIIEAEHLCMKMRGVKNQNSVMITSALRGKFKIQQSTRSEFLSLINM